jgi:D-arabinose 1-dehydrogenase-like Zn-dependent alcohol dehydrogenase
VVEVNATRLAAAELLVEVHACGVCASELDACRSRNWARGAIRGAKWTYLGWL